MQEMELCQLDAKSITDDFLRDFRRHQIVRECWRKENGQWVIKPISFVDDWTDEDRLERAARLRRVIQEGGAVFAAMADGQIRGYAAVSAQPMGERLQYLELKYLHVSEEMRGQGLGRALFRMAAAWAREHGAEKLYISAHSAVETQAFYHAMGCVEAEEYSQPHVEREPCDCQMEYRLQDDPTNHIL